jgi:hypothetical protein
MTHSETPNSAAPFELPRLGSVPREARLRRSRRFFFGFVLLLGVGMAVGFAYGGRSEYLWMLALAEEGATTDATLVAKERRGGKTKRYELDFTYMVEGRAYRGSGDVDREVYDGLELGTSLLLTYLPSDPWQCHLGRVDESMARRRRNELWIIGGLVGGGLVLVALLMGKHFRGRLLLLRRGSVREARVTEVKDVKKVQVAVRYEFRDGEGIERRGRTLLSAKDRGIAVGDPLAVLHDPHAPKRFEVVEQVLCVAELSRLSGRS